MGASEIALIVVSVITAIIAIPFGAIKLKGKGIIDDGKVLIRMYKEATADGNVSDTEKLAIADVAIRTLQNLIDLWQLAENTIRYILGIIRRK